MFDIMPPLAAGREAGADSVAPAAAQAARQGLLGLRFIAYWKYTPLHMFKYLA